MGRITGCKIEVNSPMTRFVKHSFKEDSGHSSSSGNQSYVYRAVEIRSTTVFETEFKLNDDLESSL